MTLHTRILNAIRHHRLIPPDSTLIVAVSGGADSLALLHILAALQGGLRVHLHAATLDHGLRGAAGADDGRYVMALCDQWGIPCTSGTADTPALMKAEKLGVEAAARQARYTFLADVARELGAERVAVGHHLGDQAETVIMHLIRGAGVTGLKGMTHAAPVPDHPSLTLIRPLLNVTRGEIDAYLGTHGISPRHDATNDQRDYTRNRIRLDVLPVLTAINPQADRVLAQLADTASVEDEYMCAELQRITEEVSVTPDGAGIPRAWFASLHPAFQRRLIRWAVEQIDSASEPGYEHITRAVDVGTRGTVGATALLPRMLHLRVDYEALIVERRSAEASPPLTIAPNAEIVVAVPGRTLLDGWVLDVSPEPSADAVARLSIPDDAVVLLRARRAGDRFAPFGMGGKTRKIGAWMIDGKVPRAVRDRVPLLLVDGTIAAVVWGDQWTIADDFAVNPDANKALYFRVSNRSMKNSPIA